LTLVYGVIEMKKSGLIAMALAALALSSLVLPLSGYAVKEDQAKAEKFLEIAERAHEQALMLIGRASERGVNVTEANRLVAEGESLLNQTKDFFVAGNYTGTLQRAREAQERFRDAIRALEGGVEEAEDEGVAKGLLTAISRAEERIQRLRNVVENLTMTSENSKFFDWVEGNLTEAQENLDGAKDVLGGRPLNASRAAGLLAGANKYIEDAHKALKGIGDWSVAWRAENFIKGMRKQLEKIEGQLMAHELGEIEGLIRSARGKILSGDKKGALDDIKDARDMLHDAVRGLSKSQGRGK